MNDYTLKLSHDHINDLREARARSRRAGQRRRHAVARSLHRLAARLDV